MNIHASHETLTRQDDVVAPTEKSFGVTFFVVFLLLAAVSYWHRGVTPTFYVTVAISLVSGTLAYSAPRLLRPFNLIWLKLGLLLHRVMNPLIMGLLFFGLFTPMGFVMRLLGIDFLRMSGKRNRASYWISRRDEEIADSSMKNQF